MHKIGHNYAKKIPPTIPKPCSLLVCICKANIQLLPPIENKAILKRVDFQETRQDRKGVGEFESQGGGNCKRLCHEKAYNNT
jgi:hypothetical protein